jgi:putative ABC transport system ATP-binding protein
MVLAAIEIVNRELGTTTAIITHNAPIAAMAHRVLRMTSGRIVEETRNARRARPEELVW